MRAFSPTLIRGVLECVEGIDYYPTTDAPETFEELKRRVRAEGRIPVSVLNSDRTIYGDWVANCAQRAWHDATHLALDADFTVDGERAVAEAMVKRLAKLPYITELDLIMLWTDVFGQTAYYDRNNRFPENQRGFVAGAIFDGPEVALRRYY